MVRSRSFIAEYSVLPALTPLTYFSTYLFVSAELLDSCVPPEFLQRSSCVPPAIPLPSPPLLRLSRGVCNDSSILVTPLSVRKIPVSIPAIATIFNASYGYTNLHYFLLAYTPVLINFTINNLLFLSPCVTLTEKVTKKVFKKNYYQKLTLKHYYCNNHSHSKKCNILIYIHCSRNIGP